MVDDGVTKGKRHLTAALGHLRVRIVAAIGDEAYATAPDAEVEVDQRVGLG